MSEDNGGEAPTRAWYSWWLPNLKKVDRQDSCQRIAESSAPKPTYYVLIVLSTLIASYGLVSNSTATVIGAMIVAPLMGPILGLALGTVLSDTRMFRRALTAESTGVVLVILTGILVALVVGPEHIDFSSSEIAGRTRPTLYDFAIGLAAGLAGGYCTVHPGLQASVAGVAIAVALVPPLAVTGLTTAGWLQGEVGFQEAFGSFMLFFTNLVTIELASATVFYGTGFRQGHANSQKAIWRKTLAIKAILLILTGWFLTNQLRNLLRERFGLATSRSLLVEMLKDIPGAQLDSLKAELRRKTLTITAVVGSRSDVKPPTVARFQERLASIINKNLPDVEVKLVVRTVNSTYASATGYLFEPSGRGLTNDERRTQALELALAETISQYPGVEMISYTVKDPARPGGKYGLSVTLSTPYVFGPRLVEEFQNRLDSELAGDPLFVDRTYEVLVRSAVIKNSTSESSVAVNAPELLTAEEKQQNAREEILRRFITSALEINGDLKVTDLNLVRTEAVTEKQPEPVAQPSPSPTPVIPSSPKTDSFVANVAIRSSKLVGSKVLAKARDTVKKLYQEETGRALQLSFDTTTSVGGQLFLDSESIPKVELPPDDPDQLEILNTQLGDRLAKLVAKIPGASLDGQTGLQKVGEGKNYRMFAVVTSPKPLDNKTVLAWQKDLLKFATEVESLQLQLENRLGKTIRLTPLRRDRG